MRRDCCALALFSVAKIGHCKWTGRWVDAPIVIGGTGGSGTRGVVDALSLLGIYISPDGGSDVFEHCINGEPLDNLCMFPHGKLEKRKNTTEMLEKNYAAWLDSGSCKSPPYKEGLKLDHWGQAYVDSVPEVNRKPHRYTATEHSQP